MSSILTGSIQRVGKNVRIIARLIDVETNEQIWSENYDRQIDEVLIVQSNIALEIVKMLRAKLSTLETTSISRIATTNMEAYDNYLRARMTLQGGSPFGFSRNKFNSSVALLNKAIALDPGLGDAYGLKGVAWFLGSQYGFSSRIWLDSSLYFAEKAIQLDPQNPRGYLLRHRLKMFQTNRPDYHDLSDLENAYKYAPNNTDILFGIGSAYLESGKGQGADLIVKNTALRFTATDVNYYVSWARIYNLSGDYITADKLMKEALRLEPHSTNLLMAYSLMKKDRRDNEGAIQYGLKVRRKLLDNGATWVEQAGVIGVLWDSYLMAGKLDSAEYYSRMYPEIEKTYPDTTQYIPYRHRLGFIRWQQGDRSEGTRLCQEQLQLDSARLLGKTGIGSWGNLLNLYFDLGITHAFLGNRESAYKCFDELLNIGLPDWMFPYLENDPLLKEFRKEPRFVQFFEKVQKEKQFRRDAMKAAINRYEAGRELKDRVK